MAPVPKINIFFTHLFAASGLLWHCNPTDSSRQNSEQGPSPRLLLPRARDAGECLAGELALRQTDPVFTRPGKPGRNNTRESPKMREKRVMFKETRATGESYSEGSLAVGGGQPCLPDALPVQPWSVLTLQPPRQTAFPGSHSPFPRTLSKEIHDRRCAGSHGKQILGQPGARQGCTPGKARMPRDQSLLGPLPRG